MSGQHWTAEPTSYRPSGEADETWALVCDATPNGRKNADGTTSYSMRIPALIISEYVSDPDQVAADFAGKLNVFPELLAALKKAAEIIEQCTMFDASGAYAVIAKAEGRQP